LANLRCQGKGPPYIKFERKVLYDVRDFEHWMARHKVKTEARENRLHRLITQKEDQNESI